MKDRLMSRINILEKLSQEVNGMLIFEEWLEKHGADPNQDCWVLGLVPREMQLQCLFRIFKKMKEQTSQLEPMTGLSPS